MPAAHLSTLSCPRCVLPAGSWVVTRAPARVTTHDDDSGHAYGAELDDGFGAGQASAVQPNGSLSPGTHSRPRPGIRTVRPGWWRSARRCPGRPHRTSMSRRSIPVAGRRSSARRPGWRGPDPRRGHPRGPDPLPPGQRDADQHRVRGQALAHLPHRRGRPAPAGGTRSLRAGAKGRPCRSQAGYAGADQPAWRELVTWPGAARPFRRSAGWVRFPALLVHQA